MPKNYGQPFIRLTAFGVAYDVETFAYTLSIAGGDVGQPTKAQADACLAAVRAFHVGNYTSPRHSLVGVKLARIGADGLYGATNAVTSEYATAARPAGTGPMTPAPQLALAVTLEGAQPRGPAGRGRFYVPGPAFAVAQDGRITAAQALAVANAAVTMINGINAALPGGVIIAGPETEKGRAPARQPVVAVRVGRVLDTVRSRRSSLPEEHVLATTAASNEDGFGAGGGFGGGGGQF